jgi:hypothetical protein
VWHSLPRAPQGGGTGGYLMRRRGTSRRVASGG